LPVEAGLTPCSGIPRVPLRTRLTERFGLEHPILSAPMAFVAGGALAAAVSRAGGLGLIGGGYGDGDWLGAQFAAAGNQEVGCGFITWSLALQPYLLTQALDRRPRAIIRHSPDRLGWHPKGCSLADLWSIGTLV
jgi:NAD(P)H-dependent flavin oxidoreductase YrpB (nitropropane dioxygenase family)